MPFKSQLTNSRLIAALNDFASANSFPDLYRAYSWGNDTWPAGFPDILRLESRLIRSDLTTGITLEDVKAVAAWGSLRNQRRIAGPPTIAPGNTFHDAGGAAVVSLAAWPLSPLRMMQEKLHGIGPTYLSKVLRFSLPQEYGAIDTRCIRVFGRGDTHAHRHDWIELHASNYGSGWGILKTQKHWPDAYMLWINILRHFAAILPDNCPHPSSFVKSGLRIQGQWACADVEMALFSYATRYTTRQKPTLYFLTDK